MSDFIFFGHDISRALCRIKRNELCFQISFICVRRLSVALINGGIYLLREYDAPFEEEFQFYSHGMSTSFHNDKMTFRKGLQFIGSHQWSLNHL